ncbi:hypothetical protein BH11ARM1_BH11ARM1_10100 [soil metagenome]
MDIGHEGRRTDMVGLAMTSSSTIPDVSNAVTREDVAASAPTGDDDRNVDSAALYRKLFWRLTPLIVAGCIIAYIDRVNVGIAKLQFSKQLGFDEAVYGMGAGLFYAGYLLLEVPSNLLL